MYKREFQNPNQLIPTDKSIRLYPSHLSELKESFEMLDAAIAAYQETANLPKVLIPLGTDGLHVSLNIYCDQVLVHIRYFERCYWDTESFYPTKTGITLKMNELAELQSKFPTLVAAVLP
jgi:hypothetical protein